jgi:tetratricopeptide (TPR) repeat protein
LYDVRKILVEKHNEQVPQHYPEEKIEQYDVNKNKIETLINNYYPFELFNLLKTQLNAIDESSLKPIELESLFDIKGVLESRFGELDKAIDIYEKASDKVPDSFCLNYNLALLLEKKGEMKKAFKYFSKVVSNEAEDPEILLIITRLYYLWDYYSEGLDLIQNILDMYYEIGIIDDHVVSMRGYPTYGETFANLAVFANFLKKPDLAFNELEKAKKELTDYPFEWLESQLKTFVSNSWTEGLEKIEEEIKQLREENSPLGYHLTLLL